MQEFLLKVCRRNIENKLKLQKLMFSSDAKANQRRGLLLPNARLNNKRTNKQNSLN